VFTSFLFSVPHPPRGRSRLSTRRPGTALMSQGFAPPSRSWRVSTRRHSLFAVYGPLGLLVRLSPALVGAPFYRRPFFFPHSSSLFSFLGHSFHQYVRLDFFRPIAASFVSFLTPFLSSSGVFNSLRLNSLPYWPPFKPNNPPLAQADAPF